MNHLFWKGKKVLITGHTGFKGSWLSLWLKHLDSEVVGIALEPPTTPSLFNQACVAGDIESIHVDIRDGERVARVITEYQPEIVFHLAAQPLVRYSYREPVETYETNVMGTLHVLEGIRAAGSVSAAVLITTDKCYENREWEWGYRENDHLGGYDPYSSSKGAAEVLISSYRRSYFSDENQSGKRCLIASARAGNVIGGGDWAEDRLIPDIVRGFLRDQSAKVRNPHAIRPWQHVLEPLSGYMLLAESLADGCTEHADAWNFGPEQHDAKPVEWIVEEMVKAWGGAAAWSTDDQIHPHEAHYLKLDCSKAHSKLDRWPKWTLPTALQKVVDWHKSTENRPEDARRVCIAQIEEYMD